MESKHSTTASTVPIESASLSPREFMKCFVSLEVEAKILPKLTEILKKQRGWIRMKTKNIYFHHQTQAFFPDLAQFQLGNCNASRVYNPLTFRNKFEDYTGELITHREFMDAFSKNFEFLEESFHFHLPDRFSVEHSDGYICRDGDRQGTWGKGGDNYPSHIPIFRMPKGESITFASTLLQLVKEGLLPEGLSPQEEQSYRFLMKARLCHNSMFHLQNGHFHFHEAVVDQEILKNLVPDMLQQQVGPVETEFFAEQFLCTEKNRFNLRKYTLEDLQDPQQGHWDLWDMPRENRVAVPLKEPLMARNPFHDIQKDAIVAVDLGTRTTVLAIQRPGQAPEILHFPTLLEVLDLTSFQRAYGRKEGRPDTAWTQITTAHTAFDHFLHSDHYHTFLHELKQWIGDPKRSLYLQDRQHKNLLLPPYGQLLPSAVDFLEIYAYYLGLFLNNMERGVYLTYVLSHPASYSEELKQKCLDSFRRGIQKSFPLPLLKQKDLMAEFQLSFLSTESLAYACCALQEYDFVPQGQEKIYYGVFDFGGGASSFDFGCYSKGETSYLIESVSSVSCPLGGEKLLEYLAFHLAKKNKLLLRHHRIPLECPSHCEAPPELFIVHSKIGKRNLLLLKEYLRSLWENFPEVDLSQVEFHLFDKSSEKVPRLPFQLEPEVLVNLLRKPMAEAVEQFFSSLQEALPLMGGDIPEIQLFFAGDSSKSEIFHQILEEYSELYSQKILGTTDKRLFTLHPPLGCFTQEKGDSLATCKTGVALGLLHCCPLGTIQIHAKEPPTT